MGLKGVAVRWATSTSDVILEKTGFWGKKRGIFGLKIGILGWEMGLGCMTGVKGGRAQGGMRAAGSCPLWYTWDLI